MTPEIRGRAQRGMQRVSVEAAARRMRRAELGANRAADALVREMADDPRLATRRQAASRSRFVFRGGNLAGLDVHKALLRSGPPNG